MIDARAYVVRKSGTVPEIENIQVDDDLKRGQVLVEITHTSFCGTQVEEIFSSSRNAKYMPHLFGHEASARILKTGPEVQTVQTGQEVVVHWRESSSGLDSVAGLYRKEREALNSGKVVTLSTHSVVPENRVSSIPLGIPAARAALLGCSFSTGWGAVVKSGNLKFGEAVLVIGFGGVGRAAVLAAQAHGARSITVIDPRDLSNSDIGAFGVTEIFTTIDQWLSATVGGSDLWPEVVVDTAGVVENVEKLIARVSPNSRFVLVGMPKNGEKLKLDTQKLLDGLSVKGSNGGDVDPALDFQQMSQGLDKYVGTSHTSGVVEFDWSDLKRALELQANGLLTKAIFSIS